MLSSWAMSRTIFRSPRLLKGRALPDHGLGDDELAHHVDEVVEFLDVHADRVGVGHLLGLLAQGAGHVLGRGDPLRDERLAQLSGRRDLGALEGLLQLILVDDPLLHEDGPELLGLLGQIGSLLGELDAPHDVRGVDQLRGLPAFLIVPELADHGLQGVRAVEDQVDELRRDGQGLVSRLVQQCLQVMGERPDPVQVEEAGHALDGVERPEDGIDVVLVVGLLFEVEDVQLDLADVLEALGDEVFQERLVLDPVLPCRLGHRGRLCGRGCRFRPAGLRLQGRRPCRRPARP